MKTLRTIFPSTSASLLASLLLSLGGSQAAAAPQMCLAAMTHSALPATVSNAAGAPISVGTGRKDKARIKELLTAIRKQGRDADAAPFQELAAMKSEAGFEALSKALGLIKGPAAHKMLFTGIKAYAKVDDVSEDALSFVSKHAESKQRDIAAAAIPSLSAFGEAGTAALYEIAESGRSPIGRAFAIGEIREDIRKSPTDAMLHAVLEAASVPESGPRPEVEKLIRAFKTPESFEIFARYVGASKVDVPRASLVLGALAKHRDKAEASIHEGVMQVLSSAMGGKSNDLQFLALEFAGDRGAAVDADLLKRLAKSKDETVRRAAFVAGVRASEPQFEALELASSQDSLARQAGAIGLALDGSSKALGALHALLADEDRAVRVEAIHALEVVRSKESIPFLIEILGTETGRLRGDARAALKGLTGKDLGLGASSWQKFWEREGEAFKVPSLKQIRKAERLAAKKKGGSTATFYGIELLSDSVTFIVDTSGSMQEDAYAGGTRMDAAKKQLHKAIDGLKDDARFNVISFDAVARHLGKRASGATKTTRGKAHQYVDDLRADGGTNIYAALRAAFEDDNIDTIYLVSDGDPTIGEVTDVEDLRAEVKRWNSTRNIVIHTIAIGQPHQLLRDLADDHHGKYVLVN